MAVFLLNNCKFQGCGLTFSTLADLIQHIETTHIETDVRFIERQELQPPAAVALSYVLRFYTEVAKREHCDLKKKQPVQQLQQLPPVMIPAAPILPQSPAISMRSLTPTGSEFDEDEMATEDEDSDDSYTTQEEFSSEVILSMMGSKEDDVEKPFACPVPGCKKRYKNVNGIKYHARHGHRKDTRVRKACKCPCGKSYKTTQGLRTHSMTHHPVTELLTLPVLPSPATILNTVAGLKKAVTTPLPIAAAAAPILSVLGQKIPTKPALIGDPAIAPAPSLGLLASAPVNQASVIGHSMSLNNISHQLPFKGLSNASLAPTSFSLTLATNLAKTIPVSKISQQTLGGMTTTLVHLTTTTPTATTSHMPGVNKTQAFHLITSQPATSPVTQITNSTHLSEQTHPLLQTQLQQSPLSIKVEHTI